MPYINEGARWELSGGRKPETAGELNYAITKLCVEYMRSRLMTYSTLNEVVGALESAKAEFQRRVVAPYEDQKIRENGDVY